MNLNNYYWTNLFITRPIGQYIPNLCFRTVLAFLSFGDTAIACSKLLILYYKTLTTHLIYSLVLVKAARAVLLMEYFYSKFNIPCLVTLGAVVGSLDDS